MKKGSPAICPAKQAVAKALSGCRVNLLQLLKEIAVTVLYFCSITHVAEEGVLRPYARVDNAHNHAGARLCLSSNGRPHRRVEFQELRRAIHGGLELPAGLHPCDQRMGTQASEEAGGEASSKAIQDDLIAAQAG